MVSNPETNDRFFRTEIFFNFILFRYRTYENYVMLFPGLQQKEGGWYYQAPALWGMGGFGHQASD
jgi:hypothetical protein